jgi:hypothetical protein
VKRRRSDLATLSGLIESDDEAGTGRTDVRMQLTLPH